MRFLHGCPVILVLVAVCCGNTWGQSDYARELYGNGVHAFNAGRLSEARQHLEASIGRGSHDPRAYYFLGLTKLRSGDTLGAESDFSDAASYEFQGRGNYDVGMALTRVQGQSRMRLEKVRRETKMAIRSRRLPAQPTEPAPRIAPSPYDDAPSIIEPPMDLPADDLGDPFSDDPRCDGYW